MSSIAKTDDLSRGTPFCIMNFERFFTPLEATHLQDAYDTITRLNLWDWLKGYTPHSGDDFYFDVGPEIEAIRAGLSSKEVRGTTFAWMMRRMYAIAVLGPEEWIRRAVEPSRKS